MNVLLVGLAIVVAFAALVIAGRIRLLWQKRRRTLEFVRDLLLSLQRFERLAPERRAVLAGLPEWTTDDFDFLVHQYTAYPGTAPCIPFLVAIATSPVARLRRESVEALIWTTYTNNSFSNAGNMKLIIEHLRDARPRTSALDDPMFVDLKIPLLEGIDIIQDRAPLRFEV